MKSPFHKVILKYVAFSPVGGEGNYLEMPDYLQRYCGRIPWWKIMNS